MELSLEQIKILRARVEELAAELKQKITRILTESEAGKNFFYNINQTHTVSAEKLSKLAKHLRVNPDYLLGKTDIREEIELILTEEEKAIVTCYRSVGEETRAAVKKILDIPLPSIADDIADTIARFSPVHTDKK